MIKKVIVLNKKGNIDRSLVVFDSDLICEKNSTSTKKIIAKFMEEKRKSYENLCSDKDILIFNKKHNYELAKKGINNYIKYANTKSIYVTLTVLFQLIIQFTTRQFHHFDTFLLDIQTFLLLGMNVASNGILLILNSILNKNHKKYKLGKNKLGNRLLALSVGLSLYSFINYCVPVETLPYYLSIKSTNIEDSYESREEQIDKIFTDLSNSPYLEDDEIEIINNLKEYIEENPYISLNDLYKTLMTLQVNNKTYVGKECIGAVYDPDFNTVSYYGSPRVSKEYILEHEFVHSTGNLKNIILNEGYTSILVSRIADTDRKLDYYDEYRWCTEQIIKLVGDDIVLKAYSEDNQEFLDQQLARCFKNQENVQELYDLFERYSTPNSKIEKEDVEAFIYSNITDEEKAYLSYIESIRQANSLEQSEKLLLTK